MQPPTLMNGRIKVHEELRQVLQFLLHPRRTPCKAGVRYEKHLTAYDGEIIFSEGQDATLDFNTKQAQEIFFSKSLCLDHGIKQIHTPHQGQEEENHDRQICHTQPQSYDLLFAFFLKMYFDHKPAFKKWAKNDLGELLV